MTGSRYYSRRCKRGASKNTSHTRVKIEGDSCEVFHESIIHNILIWLPASLLYNVMRYVCKTWFNIISSPDFKQAHLYHAVAGIIPRPVDKFSEYNFLRLTPVVQGGTTLCLEKTRLYLPKTTTIMDTYQGLLVLYCGFVDPPERRKHVYLVNPVTKKYLRFPVPPLSFLVWDIKLVPPSIVSPHYKVVCTYLSNSENKLKSCIAVLSLRGGGSIVDASCWRTISFDDKYAKKANFISLSARTAGKFAYFQISKVEGTSGLLAVDVERKVVHEIPAPPCYDRSHWRLPRGSRSLTAIRLCMPEPTFDVWSWDETTKWTFLFKCHPQVPAVMFNPSRLVMAWVKDQELLVFGQCDHLCYFLYNVKTGKTTSTEASDYKGSKLGGNFTPDLFNHTESLVFLS